MRSTRHVFYLIAGLMTLLIILSGLLICLSPTAVARHQDGPGEEASLLGETPSLSPSALPPLSPSPTPSSPLAPTPTRPLAPINCEADRIRFREEGKVMVGEGNVLIEYKNMRLLADKVTLYSERKEVFAEGRVEFYQGKNYVFTDRFRYDFLKEEGVLAPGSGFFRPWYGRAEEVDANQRENSFTFQQGYATTCDREEPHYRFECSKFILYPDDKIVAYNAVFYVYDVPLMWVPYYRRSIKDHCQGFFLYPGFRNAWGFYFLSGYHWCAPDIQTTLHFDYRYRRGLAYGLDGRFYIGDDGVGEWQTYYLKDKNYEDEDGVRKEMDRYLFDLWYRHSFAWRIKAYLSAHYYSDYFIRKDFFREQYESDSQPESYIYVGRTTSDYELSVQARKRLNDFYDMTERLPEAKFQVKEINLWDSNFYYKDINTYANLYKRYEDEKAARYQSQRADTFHQLSYSGKYFGWLNVLPFVNIRETYYSRGPGWTQQTARPSPVGASPTPVPSPTPEEVTDLWRRVFSTGLGVSTAIYGLFPAEDEFLQLHKLRHVIEPFANYVFTDQPTVTRDRLYQFDSVDKIQRANYTQVGIRNQLQTKRFEDDDEEVSWTLFDFLIQTNIYSFPDRDNQGNLIGDLNGELEITPFEYLGMDLLYAYDIYKGKVKRITLDAWASEEDVWSVDLGYNYRPDKGKDRLEAGVFLRLSPLWAFRVYGAYDLEDAELEEESLTIMRDLHCWDSYITFRRREATNDNEVFLVFWIKAFSQSPLNLSN